MFQIQVKRAEEDFVVVATVPTLAEGRTIVKFLDHLREINALPVMIGFYTDETEVQAHDLETFKIYEYADQDPSGASDGVWFG